MDMIIQCLCNIIRNAINALEWNEICGIKCCKMFHGVGSGEHCSLEAKFNLGNMPNFFVGVQLFKGGKTFPTIIAGVPHGAKVLGDMRLE